MVLVVATCQEADSLPARAQVKGPELSEPQFTKNFQLSLAA